MRTVLFVTALFVALTISGCGSANEAADEGVRAVKSGVKSKEDAKRFAAQKESYDRQAEDF